MHLKQELENKLNNGETIKLTINGHNLFCRDIGNGEVSNDCIFVTWFTPDSNCIAVNKDKFSKAHLKTII